MPDDRASKLMKIITSPEHLNQVAAAILKVMKIPFICCLYCGKPIPLKAGKLFCNKNHEKTFLIFKKKKNWKNNFKIEGIK
jgi:hypothetical protein